MRNGCIIVLFLFGTMASSWAQISFFNLYGGDEYDFGRDIVQTSDSGYLITGMSGSFNAGHADAFLLKLAKNGFVEWSRPFGGQENDAANKLLFIENYGAYLIGNSNSWSANNDADLYIAFTSVLGDLIWEKTFIGPSWDDGAEAALTLDTGMIVGVNRVGNETNGTDISLMRLDKNGDTIWTVDYAFEGNDSISNIEPYQDSMFLISSNRFNSTSSKLMAHLMLIHQNGQVLWEDTLGTDNGDYKINDFFISNDTMFAIGWYEENDTLASDLRHYIYKFGANGAQMIQDWSVHSADPWKGDVLTNYYGSTMRYAAYRADGFWTSPGGPDLHIGRQSYYGGFQNGVGYVETDGYDQMYAAIPTLDSGAVMVGYTSGGIGGASICVLKIGPGELYPTVLGVNYVNPLVNISTVPFEKTTFAYPNPTDGIITINYGNIEAPNYQVVGMNGVVYQEGRLPENGQINLGALSAGVYLIQMKNESSILRTARIFVK